MRLTLDIVGKTLFDAEVGADAGARRRRAHRGDAGGDGEHQRASSRCRPSWPTPGNLRAKNAIAALDDVIYRIIRERRADGDDHGDFLSMLSHGRGRRRSGAR